MKPEKSGPKKSAPFPRVTRKSTPQGKVEMTDTGLYVHRTTKHLQTDASQWEPYQPAEKTLSTMDELLKAVLAGKPAWPVHMYKLADELLLEISEAKDFIRLDDTAAAAASCLLIGKMFEMLRVSEVEPEFIKRRLTVEATRRPRNRDTVWKKLEPYFKKALKRGTVMTAGQLYQVFLHRFAAAYPMAEESFNATANRKIREWKESTNDKA